MSLFITAAHAASGAGGGGAFPPFDASTFAGQLFWLAVVFGALYWLMANVALPRVASIIEDRRARIAADLDTAATAQKAAADAQKAFEANLAQAKAKAQGIAQSARDAASREADARRHQVETDLTAKMVAAEKAIAETKAKAMANVEGIATDAAAAIVERLGGSKPGDKAITDAVAALSQR
ncbi:MAG TPA: F0F1 ATP synthase subunit B' [Beijerinckiaceae bacterium]|nr:F0F1 ATP synthase subunit B' [Beijerinckiaceae bacterium]